MLSSDREKVLKSIHDLNKVVSVADVASRTGLSVERSRQLLNEIALSNGGWLQVHQSGGIAYCFTDPDKAARRRGTLAAIAKVWKQVTCVLSRLLNWIVGIGLILCLGFVFGVCLTTVSLIAYLMWRANTYLRGLRNQESEKSFAELMQQQWKRLEQFFLDCHHFVLGAGNPNAQLQEQRWHMLAELIQGHNGVLIYEQIAPFSLERFNYNRETAILPILLHFNGDAEVSANGNIIYTFHELSASANQPQLQQPKWLEEKRWQFSGLTPAKCLAVAGIIVLNIAALLAVPVLIPMEFVFRPIWQTLLAYGIALALLPVLRCFIVTLLNTAIFFRNSRRKNYSRKLDNPSRALTIKLSDAASFSFERRIITAESVVYDTSKDLLEQQFDQQG